MPADLDAARAFLATHARVLDRRRLDLLFDAAAAQAALAALDAYRNPDGGYGCGLEPDLRSPESQPAAALHAFEVMAEAGPTTTRRAVQLCDWLDTVSLPDGGLPFALPVADPAGCAPFWVDADPTTSSLQITAIVAMHAHRVARHDDAVATHSWLGQATAYCLDAVRAIDDAPHAYVLSFALQFLDTVAATYTEAPALIEQLARHVPPDGMLAVEGGLADETLRALDFAPEPGRPVRSLLADGVVEAELARLADEQQDDGGWPVEWATSSPAATLEWRGYLTVRAITVLQRNGALP